MYSEDQISQIFFQKYHLGLDLSCSCAQQLKPNVRFLKNLFYTRFMWYILVASCHFEKDHFGLD